MSVPLEKGQSGIEIMLIDAAGNLQPATIDLFFRDWTDTDGYCHTDCQIKPSWAGGIVEGMDWNYFAAFKQVRQQLVDYGLLPVYYGASRRVIMTAFVLISLEMARFTAPNSVSRQQKKSRIRYSKIFTGQGRAIY